MASFSASATGTSSIECSVSGLQVVSYDRRFDVKCTETGEEHFYFRYSGESSGFSLTFRNLSSGTTYHFTVKAYNIDNTPESLIWNSSASATTDSPVVNYTMTVRIFEGSTQFGNSRSTTKAGGTAYVVARWVAEAGYTAATLPDSDWEFDHATCNGVTYSDEAFTDVPLNSNSTLDVYYKLRAGVHVMKIHTLLDGSEVDVKSATYQNQTQTVGEWITSLHNLKGLIIPNGYFDYATAGSRTGVVLDWDDTVGLTSDVEMWARWDSTPPGPEKGPYVWATKNGVTKWWLADGFVNTGSWQHATVKVNDGSWKP